MSLFLFLWNIRCFTRVTRERFQSNTFSYHKKSSKKENFIFCSSSEIQCIFNNCLSSVCCLFNALPLTLRPIAVYFPPEFMKFSGVLYFRWSQFNVFLSWITSMFDSTSPSPSPFFHFTEPASYVNNPFAPKSVVCKVSIICNQFR